MAEPRGHLEDEVLEVLYGVVDEVNLQLPADNQMEKSPNTVVAGPGGTLDSLGLITLLVGVEDAVAHRFGVSVLLLEPENPLEVDGEPLRIRDIIARIEMELEA